MGFSTIGLWHDIRMNIGTWNMEGRGGVEQTNFLLDEECDVLLLTEVKEGWSLPGYHLTLGKADMAPGKRWAVVASKDPLVQAETGHPASAAAIVDGATYVSSILPWAGSGGNDPWLGEDHSARMANTLNALAPFLRSQANLVWVGTGTIRFPDLNEPAAMQDARISYPLSRSLG